MSCVGILRQCLLRLLLHKGEHSGCARISHPYECVLAGFVDWMDAEIIFIHVL